MLEAKPELRRASPSSAERESSSASASPMRNATRQVESRERGLHGGHSVLRQRPRLATQYGPGSEAAKKGRQQYFLNASPQLYFIVLNTHRPLFRDVRLRKAVNFALDRRCVRAAGPRAESVPRATDRPVPAAWGTGVQRTHGSTRSLPKSRRLGAWREESSGAPSSTPATFPPATSRLRSSRANLAAIGIDLQIKTLPLRSAVRTAEQDGRALRPRRRSAGLADYLDPAQFLNFLLLSGIIPDVRRPGVQAQARGRGAALRDAAVPGLRQARRRPRPQRGPVGCDWATA